MLGEGVDLEGPFPFGGELAVGAVEREWVRAVQLVVVMLDVGQVARPERAIGTPEVPETFDVLLRPVVHRKSCKTPQGGQWRSLKSTWIHL